MWFRFPHLFIKATIIAEITSLITPNNIFCQQHKLKPLDRTNTLNDTTVYIPQSPTNSSGQSQSYQSCASNLRRMLITRNGETAYYGALKNNGKVDPF